MSDRDYQKGKQDGRMQEKRTPGQTLFSRIGSSWDKGFDKGNAERREEASKQAMREDVRKKSK
jgi:hypothetical protein